MDIKNIFPEVSARFREIQRDIYQSFVACESADNFLHDSWEKEGFGSGLSLVLRGGKTFESAGVNFSHVKGTKLPDAASAKRHFLVGSSFEAVGVSIVVHPQNPFVPTSHANIRLFAAYPENAPAVWWFGGGFDLTPFYPFDEDILEWHKAAFHVCDKFGSSRYEKYKAWCDEYFYLKHRNETRGVGGLFFDDVNDAPFEDCFNFVQNVARTYLESYQKIVLRRKDTPFSDSHRNFQLYRRGRYVEFNLLYDRGTLFGLQSGHRVESILMSMPPQVRFEYSFQPSASDARLHDYLRARNWLEELKE